MLVRFLVDDGIVGDFDFAPNFIKGFIVVDGFVAAIKITRFIIKAQWCISMVVYWCTTFALSRKWFSGSF